MYQISLSCWGNVRCLVQRLKEIKGKLVSLQISTRQQTKSICRCNGLYSSPQETSVSSKVINNTTKHYNNTTYKLVNKIDRKDVYSNSKKGIERQTSRTVPITFHNSKPFNGNSAANEVTKPIFGKVFEDKVANHSIIGECIVFGIKFESTWIFSFKV